MLIFPDATCSSYILDVWVSSLSPTCSCNDGDLFISHDVYFIYLFDFFFPGVLFIELMIWASSQ